ncbi:phosphatidylglycerophosphatase A family protein [Pseudohongiella sp.]|uniref:YutG/PgpA domain-containing protein n=1 Tax=marine sediment metagenome TaxID=412755 RepID=A0A0F9W7U5_9ZZZZ|nr:phosphatidylglycerophosphatase A [Pseudohongiella sp.]HDZ07586.1 phosphatidylglycerophosphatase A [Pseudohongiella sp.]HEA64374.1 phosphatidylglycerophosphatase A [Pseudohongiella sp.]
MSKTPASVWRNPVHFLAFGLGSGAAAKAPGTFGTLAGALIWLLLPPMGPLFYLLFLALTFAVGIWLCGRTAEDIGVHDHGGIVWDEFVGLWLTMFLAPPGLLWLVLGFLLFRVFDILKPWPIAWCDKHVEGGLGIMIDDVLAGLMALACLQLIAVSIL